MTSSERAEGANVELECFFAFMLDGSVLAVDDGQAQGMTHSYAAMMYLISEHGLHWGSGYPTL